MGEYPFFAVLRLAVSPLRRVTFFKRQKGNRKGFAPAFGPRRLGFLRCGIDPGAASPVCFAAPPLAVFGFAKRSLRSHARINPSAQPSEVARGSKALELTLIVEWGGFAAGSCAALFFCGSEPAREGGLTADLFLTGVCIPTVGASLLAMASFRPTNFYQIHAIQL
ncbi:hypothetical protein HU755_22775 [Pseudomonas sp. SWRI111]|uniref:hypothetical protein n=1 Tax=Pseudomonas sp. SWRI111 TaxID=2745507 RepID=UPI001645E6CC|nr:hypothetical protein [Pseudomonas sp. SWRI111]MBC3209637.1 hypothetical protein [Pseudomonas sp. SWRI111]